MSNDKNLAKEIRTTGVCILPVFWLEAQRPKMPESDLAVDVYRYKRLLYREGISI